MSVCLTVYLSAPMSQKLHVQISPNFVYVLPVAMVRSSVMAMRYVILCIFVLFSDDVRFSHNAGNRSDSKTTPKFHPVRLPGGSTGGEVCFLQLYNLFRVVKCKILSSSHNIVT